MTTRMKEEKRFIRNDDSIGNSLASNFLQNRNLLASFENKEADLWAGGGEHLSTSKLSSMLNSMQVSTVNQYETSSFHLGAN